MILYGKPVTQKIYEDMKKEIALEKLKPFLAVILVGENQASLTYIRAKEKIAKNLGIGFRLYQFPQIAREAEVLKLINNLNRNDYISGIVVQLPLPEKMNTDEILRAINPKKDVDGFYGEFSTPAARAIIEMLNYYKINLDNKKIAIIGHGRLVGRPLEKILVEQNLNVEVCNKDTRNLKEITENADIIISATGQPGIIDGTLIKKDVVVIDAGTAEVSGKISGDISKEVYDKVNSYSPVPGGVGPVTVACLMSNLVQASRSFKN